MVGLGAQLDEAMACISTNAYVRVQNYNNGVVVEWKSRR